MIAPLRAAAASILPRATSFQVDWHLAAKLRNPVQICGRARADTQFEPMLQHLLGPMVPSKHFKIDRSTRRSGSSYISMRAQWQIRGKCLMTTWRLIIGQLWRHLRAPQQRRCISHFLVNVSIIDTMGLLPNSFFRLLSACKAAVANS